MSEGFKEQLIHLNLGKIKDAVKNERAIFIERPENKKTLYDYNLSTNDVYRIIVELTEESFKITTQFPGAIYIDIRMTFIPK